MKKQFSKKKLMTFGVLGLFAFVLVSAAVFTFVFKADQDVTVKQSLSVNGEVSDTSVLNSYSIFNGWEQKETSDAYVITNAADRDLNVDITSTADTGITVSHDTVGLSTTWSSDSSALADVSLSGSVVSLLANEHAVDFSDASEARVTVGADEIEDLLGLGTDLTLNDLNTISWEFNLANGYVPHIDIFLDTGVVLIIEGAHQNGNSVTGWATGTWLQTFFGVTCSPHQWATWLSCPSDLTTVNDKTNVWRSGVSGGTAGNMFDNAPGSGATNTDGTLGPVLETLGKYQLGYNEISGSNKVVRIEIEIDAWVLNSESQVRNIVVNGVSKEISTQTNLVTVNKDGGSEVFYVNSVFADNLLAGTYDITTTVA